MCAHLHTTHSSLPSLIVQLTQLREKMCRARWIARNKEWHREGLTVTRVHVAVDKIVGENHLEEDVHPYATYVCPARSDRWPF